MLSILLPAPIVGLITFAVLFASLLWSFAMIVPGALLKLIPHVPLQRACSRYCVWVASQWASNNQVLFRLIHPAQWDVDIRGTLDPKRSYLLVCNHQSWADIVILFDAFHGRVPLLRFFLKQELKYVPIIGIGCWAMDFPFMKRHSREAIAAHPELRNEDLETTRRACEIYKSEPVTVVNFLEGTRFTEAKRIAKKSPFRHLLRPKSAGISFALNALGEQFAGIIDVTLAYRPTNKYLWWSWLCGEQDTLSLYVDVRPLPMDLLNGNYEDDPEFRARFQAWVNDLWVKKDARLDRLANQPIAPPARPAPHY